MHIIVQWGNTLPAVLFVTALQHVVRCAEDAHRAIGFSCD
jgi:hypothetical protein